MKFCQLCVAGLPVATDLVPPALFVAPVVLVLGSVVPLMAPWLLDRLARQSAAAPAQRPTGSAS